MKTLSRKEGPETRAYRRLGFASILILVMLAMLTGGQIPVSAHEDLADLPIMRFSRDYTSNARQYDLLQTLVELEPGAAVPWHRVNGKAIITVLSGQVTRIEEGGHSEVFKAGETFDEISEDHVDIDINKGHEPARFLATFLLDLGAEPLIFDTEGRPYADAPGPEFLAVARTSVGRIPAQFTLTHAIFEVPAGLDLPPHTHDAWNIVTELTGRAHNIVDGVEQGSTFAHGPRDVHEVTRNDGPAFLAMSASVGPAGTPPIRFLNAAP